MTVTPQRMRWRARLVPILSTVAASLTAVAPVVALWPLMPPFGLLMLLGWRLLRPELWPAWVALPLGLFDDLATGRPPGTSPLIWTALFLAIDAADRWMIWRDHRMDWAVAATAITAAALLGYALAFATGGAPPIIVLVPQLVSSILLFPVVARLCARLDRWRLMR